MNRFDAKAIPHVGGGYLGLFRLVHKADYRTVCENGEPKPFPSKVEAENAAMRVIIELLNTDIRRDGETLTGARAKAEKLFPGIVKQRGATKAVEVVRR